MALQKYTQGQLIEVVALYPPGHVRTPYFIRGKKGTIDHFLGFYPNPEELAYGRRRSPECALYRVEFLQINVWNDYKGPQNDKLYIDIYEHWLETTK